MRQVAVGVTGRAVVAHRQRRGRAPRVHLARRFDVLGTRPAHGDLVALRQREHVPAGRHARPEPGVEPDQGVRAGELGGREGQVRALHHDRPAGGVAQPHHGLLQHTLGGRRGVRTPLGQRADRAPAQQLAQRERQLRRVQRGTRRQRQNSRRGVHQIVRVGPLHPGVAAAPGGRGPRQLGGQQRGRGAYQQLVDGAVGQWMGLEGQNVDLAVGQGPAQCREASRFVPYGRTHPPQGEVVRGGGGAGVPAGITGAASLALVRRRRMAPAPGEPDVEPRRAQQRRRRGRQHHGARGTVGDHVGGTVGDRHRREQGGQLDGVAPPVVTAPGILRGCRITHAATLAERCCVITNVL